jgi:NAD(P)-dependent dehydrogenase (short-subunit alcohol dehydrogenase family)
MSKVWFITGASSGLGAELTKAIMEKGDNVVATFRKREQAEAFSEIAAGKGLGVIADVTHYDQLDAAIERTLKAYGRIDVLINNAGYGTVGAIEEFTLDEIRAQMETNFFGVVYLTKKILPLLREQGGGHIIQMSSQAGFRAAPGFGVYNSSKFALEGFSEALAQEVAPFNIRVVLVEPGPFRTEFAGSSIKAAKNRLEEYKQTPVAQTYQYIDQVNGNQEGDPVKAAKAIVHYVYDNRPNLRLPLGSTPLKVFRMKMEQVEADLKANESIALSAVYQGNS